jgi:hypothetical protein
MMAQNHELAFGLDYDCTFTVTNKTGAPLYVKINGREDKNIRFDFSLDADITGTKEYAGRFYVGEINQLQDTWQVHPCVLANMEINGQKVTFGMGICAKYPLSVSLSTEATVLQAGMEVPAFINIRSALLQDATVTFTVPKTDFISFKENTFTAKITADGKTAIPTAYKILAAGYHAMPLQYDITLADGTPLHFKKPLHVVNQDLTAMFAGENDNHYFIINGVWKVSLNKADNEAWIHHLTNPHFRKGNFWQPKFGKPYDDEFNLIKPTVKTFIRDTNIVMEAEFISQKFDGMVLTMVITLSAVGIITRGYRVENRSQAPRELHLNSTSWLDLDVFTTFKYKGQFTQNHNAPIQDYLNGGIDSIDPEGLEENWLFEANPAGGRGYCWSLGTKVGLQWGSMAILETDLGQLLPNQVLEIPPMVCVYGLFSNFGDFRNYAMRLWDKKNYVPAHLIEIFLNDYNLFIGDKKEVTLDIMNNREVTLEGTITVSSPLFAAQSVTHEGENEDDNESNATTKTSFALKFEKDPAELAHIRVDMHLSDYEKTYQRVLFPSKGEILQTEEGTVYTVSNGKITFRVDPVYGPVCYSLTTADGNEWMTSVYPEHKAFAWWSPFLGGVRAIPNKFMNVTLLKEKIAAHFTKVQDNYGNTWQGICTTVHINENDDLRGAVLETYYLTLPNLPMLCSFYRFVNGTGMYCNEPIEFAVFVKPANEGEDFYTDMVEKSGHTRRLRFGAGADMEASFENMVKISSQRTQKLYFFHGNKNNGKYNELGGDVKFPLVLSTSMEMNAAPDKAFTSSPMFLLFTADDIGLHDLDDLERVSFDGL